MTTCTDSQGSVMGTAFDVVRQAVHCLRCGAPLPVERRPNLLECPQCGFTVYFNPAVAAAAFVVDASGRVLLAQRAREPSIGLWALPGGFIDAGERAEEAVRREVLEEVGLVLEEVRFLCSQPNVYPYAGVTYPVLDLFFVARSRQGMEARPLDEVARVQWWDPSGVDPEQLAFPSIRRAWHVWRASVA